MVLSVIGFGSGDQFVDDILRHLRVGTAAELDDMRRAGLDRVPTAVRHRLPGRHPDRHRCRRRRPMGIRRGAAPGGLRCVVDLPVDSSFGGRHGRKRIVGPAAHGRHRRDNP